MGRFKLPLLIVAFACSGSMASAEQPAGKLAWDQHAPNLATAQSYQYTLVIDGGPPRLLGDVRCVGVAEPFKCAAPLPELGQGAHTLTLTAVALADGLRRASPHSAPLAIITLREATSTSSRSTPGLVAR